MLISARDGKLVRPAEVLDGHAVFRAVSGTHTWAWATSS